jgi:hypothetical protein
VYFTSYARLDAKGTRLDKVFERIKDRVRSLLGIGSAEELAALAFVDSQSIDTGEEWRAELATAVHEASVLVCFLSPTYFNSEWCAKEFAVFRRRLAAAGARPRAIIPVLWEIGFIPSAVARYQHSNDRFPKSYASEGLRALCALKASRDDAEKAIGLIAAAIHAAAADALPPIAPCLDFAQLPRSFDNPGPYGIALLAVTARGPQTRIGLSDTLARIVDRVADQLKIPWRELPVDAAIPATIGAAVADRQVVVVITDEASTAAMPVASHLDQLQAVAAPVLVLVGTSAAAPDDAAARARLPGLAAGGVHTIEAFSLKDAGALQSQLAARVTKRRAGMIAADPLVKVDDAQLAGDADRAGIAITSRPGIRGPGNPT